MLRGQDVDLYQAKIMIDLLVRGIGIDQREPNRVFFVFVYSGVKGRDITVFNALSLFCFGVQGDSPRSAPIEGVSWV